MTSERQDRLNLDVDLRLMNVWEELYSRPELSKLLASEDSIEAFSICLRYAYERGYRDALTDKGKLYIDNGFRPPTNTRPSCQR